MNVKFSVLFTVATLMLLLICSASIQAKEVTHAKEVDVVATQQKEQPKSAYANQSKTWQIHCARGQSISWALSLARPGDTIRVIGSCHDVVVIDKDKITLEGVAGANIDGSNISADAVVLVDGARNIVIRDLSIINGMDQGVLIQRQAQVKLTNLSLTNHLTVALSVDGSNIEIENLTMTNNSGGGMDAYSASTVLARGQVNASDNGGDGIAVNGKTFLELRGGTITANQNQGSGVSVINDSRLQIFSFPEAQGSRITADSNGFAGIALLGGELGVVGSQYFGSGANEINANYNVFGFFMPSGGIFSPHATAKFIATNNFTGMLIEDGGSSLIVGGLNISQNVQGIAAAGAGTLNFVSVPPNPSTVDTNQLDLNFSFGSRVTLDGVTASSIVCDPTVMMRGSLACP